MMSGLFHTKVGFAKALVFIHLWGEYSAALQEDHVLVYINLNLMKARPEIMLLKKLLRNLACI